jgi:hypothetical protein
MQHRNQNSQSEILAGPIKPTGACKASENDPDESQETLLGCFAAHL